MKCIDVGEQHNSKIKSNIFEYMKKLKNIFNYISFILSKISNKVGIYYYRPEICENIVLWAQDRGWNIQKIHEPFIIDYPIPTDIVNNKRLNALFQVVNGLGFPSQFVVTIPNASVIGDKGMVVGLPRFDGHLEEAVRMGCL
jgi:hypothetical protein